MALPTSLCSLVPFTILILVNYIVRLGRSPEAVRQMEKCLNFICCSERETIIITMMRSVSRMKVLARILRIPIRKNHPSIASGCCIELRESSSDMANVCSATLSSSLLSSLYHPRGCVRKYQNYLNRKYFLPPSTSVAWLFRNGIIIYIARL